MVAYYDPKTKKAVGIICDVCNVAITHKFEYYYCDFGKAFVDADAQKSGVVDSDENHLRLDFCVKCYKALEKKVRVNIRKRENPAPKNKSPKGSKGGKWTTET